MTDQEVTEIQLKEAEEERRLLAARELGQAVNQRLKELRWVQQDLADELNTSQSVISAIIAGNYLLTFDLVTRLSKALRLSPLKLASYFWREEEQEISNQNESILERIRELLTEYYQIGRHQPLDEPPVSSRRPETQSDIDANLKRMREKAKNKKKPKLPEHKLDEPPGPHNTNQEKLP